MPGPIDSLVGPVVDADSFLVESSDSSSPWTWQVLPDGLIYRSYLAGPKEPRISGTFFYEKDQGWLLDTTVGARVGIIRLGTAEAGWPQGWQLDIEGAAFPRLDLERNWDLQSADFRFGIPLTYGVGPFQTKLAYYHLSSHLGDELLIRNRRLLRSRINFSRDTLVAGWSTYPSSAWRIYSEIGWAFTSDGGSQPWELQFGTEWSPPGSIGVVGAPFVAINVYLREEVDFGGTFVFETGWQTRGVSGHLLRFGLHYLNGKSNQFQFFDESEQQLGLGLWYDF